MTNEEIKKELSKIPEEDREKIKVVESLSDEEIANISGGASETTETILRKLHLDDKLSPTAKNILENVVKAGGFITFLAGTWYVGKKMGYKQGYDTGKSETNARWTKIWQNHDKCDDDEDD